MKLSKCILLASAGLVLAPSVAYGQEEAGAQVPTAADDTAGNAIVVTAQRREQSLSDVGLSIAVIGEEELDQRNFDAPEDLAKLVPGLSVSNSGFSTPIYTLRGVGINEPSVGSSSSVAVYVDEVPLAYPSITQGATLDLQRLEVLKGPQGTLYGQNSTGGAINYIANKPTNDLEAGLTTTFGRFDRGSVEGFVSGPLGPTLKARIAARGSFGDGWQRSITRDAKLGDVENYTGRFILEFEPAQSVRFALNLNGWIDKSDTQAAQLQQIAPGNPALVIPAVANAPIAPAKPRAADWGPGNNFNRDDEFWQASLRADVDLNDAMTLTSITAYSNLDRHQLIDSDGIANATNIHQNQNGSIKSLSQEVRLSGDIGRVNWIVGGNYSDDTTVEIIAQDLRDLSTLQSLLGFPINGATVTNRQDIESWAVFTNIDFELTDQLTLTGGIRYSEDSRVFEGCARPLDTLSAVGYQNFVNFFRGLNGLGGITLTPNDCYTFYATAAGQAGDTEGLPLFTPGLANRELKENNVPWNVGINFNPDPDSLIYARVSRGYKAGNFATLGLIDNALFGPIVQEKLTAFEVGGRYSVPGLLRIEGALFQYNYVDKQLRARINSGPPFGNVAAQDNIPKSRIRGAEMSAVLRPAEGLTLSASAVYLDSEIREYMGFTVLGTAAEDLSGSPFNFTPEWNLNGDLNYSHPVSDTMNAFVGVNIAYRSATSAVFVPPGNTSLSAFDIDGYTLVDGQLGVEDSDGRWRAFIWGKNLLSEYYSTNVIKGADVVIRYAGMPATYGATVSYRFN